MKKEHFWHRKAPEVGVGLVCCRKEKVGVARGLEVREAAGGSVELQKPSHTGQDGKAPGASEQGSDMFAVWRAGEGEDRESG